VVLAGGGLVMLGWCVVLGVLRLALVVLRRGRLLVIRRGVIRLVVLARAVVMLVVRARLAEAESEHDSDDNQERDQTLPHGALGTPTAIDGQSTTR
jgi:hypothetical protein